MEKILFTLNTLAEERYQSGGETKTAKEALERLSLMGIEVEPDNI